MIDPNYTTLAEALKRKPERNLEIYTRFLRGEKKADLAREYKLDPARITVICRVVEKNLLKVMKGGK